LKKGLSIWAGFAGCTAFFASVRHKFGDWSLPSLPRWAGSLFRSGYRPLDSDLISVG
jgi:hypothetical protein